jgi:hypothetical protein
MLFILFRVAFVISFASLSFIFHPGPPHHFHLPAPPHHFHPHLLTIPDPDFADGNYEMGQAKGEEAQVEQEEAEAAHDSEVRRCSM